VSDGTRTWVLAYDVADDRRRARMAKFLEARGQRVQESVFEVLASADELDALLRAATEGERFDAAVDSVRAWPLCAACQPMARVVGVGPAVSAPGKPIVL